jgi:chromosomal replication initiator protein
MAGQPGSARNSAAASKAIEGPASPIPALRAAMCERLGEARFRLWFGDGVQLGLSGDGSSLEVRVPDSFFSDWIRRHYSTSLLEVAEEIAGRPMQLSIEVRGEAEPPLDDVVKPRPAEDEPRPRHTITIPMPADPKSPLFPSAPNPGSVPIIMPDNVPPGRTDRKLPFERGSSTASSAGSATAAPARTSNPQPAGRPLRRLDDFTPGPANRLALAAAREMVRSAGSTFNPLVIHGAVGLGKTHLLEGIGHALRQARPGVNLVQLTAETFTNGFLEAMRTGTLSSFRGRNRKAAALIVDDIHFLAAKRATQDEFLHTFNAVLDRGGPIILASDQHPRLIPRLTDELVTRFLGGMVVKIEAPDLMTRRAILKARASARGVEVPDAVIGYIAEHLRSSVRELEGALHSVIAQAVLTGKRLDLALVKTALRDTVRHTAQSVALRDIERAVCHLFQVGAEALKSDSRTRALAYPRMMAMYLARKHTGAAYSEIGRYFGGRNHSTVISAEKKVLAWLAAEQRSGLLPGFETVADLLNDLERTLGT